MQQPDKMVALHPAAVAHYNATADDLPGTLARRDVRDDEAAATAIRDLVAAVIVRPAGRDESKLEVTDRLANPTDAPGLFRAGLDCRSTLVAGSGIEPPTYGL
jgi:site-specific DNA recombinase